MYSLTTNTGFSTRTTTVEQVASALAVQLRDRNPRQPVDWTITTPHGSVVSDCLPAGPLGIGSEAAQAHVAAVHLDHAYGLLVRDHLTSVKGVFNSGLFLTLNRRAAS